MAEQHHSRPEASHDKENRAEHTPDSFKEAHDRSKQHESAKHHEKDVDSLRKEVEKKAEKAAEVAPKAEKESNSNHSFGVSKELKETSYKRTLDTAYSHLSKPEKALSKVVHQPVIEKISEVSSKTVARPSGIATGGLIALVGTMVALFAANRYGYSYNFLLVIILYVTGYGLGVILEMLMKMFKRNR